MLTENRRLELQYLNLMRLAKHGEPNVSTTWFPYTSGKIGPYYMQSIAATWGGGDYAFAIDSMVELIRGTVDLAGFVAVSGGESRDWDFSNPVAYALEMGHRKIYKDGTILGPVGLQRLLHVADLNNEGSSFKEKWVPAVQREAGTIGAAFFYVDRLEDGTKVLQELGIPHYSVVPMDGNAWQALRDVNRINEAQLRSCNEYLDDREAWGRNALRAHTQGLIALLSGNEKSRAKGMKILNAGYPDMKDELIDRMKHDGFDYALNTPE